MTYGDIYKKAKGIIGEENIIDFRPATFSTDIDGINDSINVNIPNTIIIWLKNGDCIWYRAMEG